MNVSASAFKPSGDTGLKLGATSFTPSMNKDATNFVPGGMGGSSYGGQTDYQQNFYQQSYSN